MIKFGKKAVAVVLVAMMALTSLVGCGKEKNAKLDEKAVFMTVGKSEVTVGLAHFYIRYQQSLMEGIFGTDTNKWKVRMENGETREESIKNAIVEQLQQLYIIYEHADDYDIKLEELELEYIDSLAEEFEKANTKDARKKAGATKENAAEYMKVSMTVMKVEGAMKKDIDTDIDLEEAKQKRMSVVTYSKLASDSESLSKDEIKEQEKAAKDFLKAAKENGNLNAYATEKEVKVEALTFDASSAETSSLGKDVIKKADKLAENEFSDVIETDDAFYVLQLESLYDEDATDAKMESILEERGEARYKELLEKWEKETKISVDEDVLEQISFHDLEVNYVQEEEEEESEESTEGGENTETGDDIASTKEDSTTDTETKTE